MVVALCSWCHGCRYAEDMAWRTAYEISLDIAAPIDTVWGLLADGRSWSDWSFIPRSELECEGIPAPDGVGAIRRLGMPPIVSRERIVEFTPPSRLVYESVGGIPVSGYRATNSPKQTAAPRCNGPAPLSQNGRSARALLAPI